MLDVLHGTGTSKSVSNAQTIGFSTRTTFASLSLINVQPSITLEPANLVIKDTILTKENAS